MKVKFQVILKDGYECEGTVTDTTIKVLEYQYARALRRKGETITLADEKSSTIILADEIRYIRLEEVRNE